MKFKVFRVMGKLLLAKDIVSKNLQTLKIRCEELKNIGSTPRLDVILVGNNPASELYVRNKKRMCEKVGAIFNLIRLSDDISPAQFLNEVEKMNNNPAVTGCFVQLPIPKQLDSIDITELINPQKDIDGFHSQNIMKLYNNRPGLISCTPKGIVRIFKENNIDLAGKNIVIIGRGFIVGKPLSLLLQNENATVTVCHSKSHDIKQKTKSADIIIVAVGKAKMIDQSYLNDHKKQIIIDVGINKDESGKLCGDVDFENVIDKVSAITPVPGGVGPMTVYSLIENLIEATQNQIKD